MHNHRTHEKLLPLARMYKPGSMREVKPILPRKGIETDFIGDGG
jgi:hypothetical protein